MATIATRRPTRRCAGVPQRRSPSSPTSTSWTGELQHRALLERAAFLIAPSRWAAAALRRYYPEHAVEVVPHAAPVRAFFRERTRKATPRRGAASCPCSALPDDGLPTIAVLGAVGPDKGARRLERLAELVRATVSSAALRADWLHGRGAWSLAERRRRADDSRPLPAARITRAPGAISGAAGRVSVGWSGDLQLYAFRGLGGRLAGRRSALRRAGRARRRHGRGLALDGCRVARRRRRCWPASRSSSRPQMLPRWQRPGRAVARFPNRRRARWRSARAKSTMQRSRCLSGPCGRPIAQARAGIQCQRMRRRLGRPRPHGGA